MKSCTGFIITINKSFIYLSQSIRRAQRKNFLIKKTSKIPSGDGGRWCFCCFIQISRPLFIERRTFARPIPTCPPVPGVGRRGYLATSAAECPVSSTAKYATNALASAIFFCLLPEQINFGLRPNCPATNSINSSMGRLGLRINPPPCKSSRRPCFIPFLRTGSIFGGQP